jgi:hypothetical protein
MGIVDWKLAKYNALNKIIHNMNNVYDEYEDAFNPPGDGNCLFSCVVWHYFRNRGIVDYSQHSQELRAMTAYEMKTT